MSTGCFIIHILYISKTLLNTQFVHYEEKNNHKNLFSPESNSINKIAHFENTDPVTSSPGPMFSFGVPVEEITGYQEL